MSVNPANKGHRKKPQQQQGQSYIRCNNFIKEKCALLWEESNSSLYGDLGVCPGFTQNKLQVSHPILLLTTARLLSLPLSLFLYFWCNISFSLSFSMLKKGLKTPTIVSFISYFLSLSIYSICCYCF